MFKAILQGLCGLAFGWLVSGCATVDGLKLMYGNQYASHSWQQNKTHTSLPFEYLNEHTIVIASVDGASNLRMVLDTGAAATVFFETGKTQSLLNRLGNGFSVGGIGDGEGSEAYFINDVNLTLGTLTISGLTTVFIKADSNPMFATPDETYIDGVIGYDLFSRFTTEIDFDHQRVRISEESLTPKEDYTRLSLTIKNNLAYTDITIRGKKQSATVSALFDTGGIGPLLLDGNQNIPEGQVLYTSTASGLSGDKPVTANRLDAAVVGGYEIPNIIVAIAQKDSDKSKSKSNIMGTGLINRFNLIVDYPDQQIWLAPNQYFHKADRVNQFGARLMPHKQGALVHAIRQDTLAMQLGVQEKDVIVSVDDVPVNYHNFDTINEKLAQLTSVQQLCYLRDSKPVCKVIKP